RLLQHSHRRWTPPVGTVRFRAQPHQWRLFGGSATDSSGPEAGARRLRSANLIAEILPFSLQKRKTPRRITSTRRFWLTTWPADQLETSSSERPLVSTPRKMISSAAMTKDIAPMENTPPC